MKTLVASLLLFCWTNSFAQHHQHDADTSNKDHPATTPAPMCHSFSLSLPMTRNGSGTGWMPDSSIMYGHGIMTNQWMFMFHGNIFLRSNWQDITHKSDRGDQKTDAPNWFMGMGQRKIGEHGLFRFSAMFSLDPITIGSRGYPLLYQSGETYNNQPIVDRQHPHDLFSELSVAYTHMITRDIDLTAYLAYPGEPALGPVAFMHRNSAQNNPDAPLGHHWQDATHITYGVATIGLRVGIIKAEGSIFTGREPDDSRYGLDKPRFDSYSLRILCNPNEQIALQISQAFITSPEALHPEENIMRTTASVIHNLQLAGTNRYVATTIVWGYNSGDEAGNSILIEPNVQLDRTAIYARYEWVEKTAADLNLLQFEQQRTFNVQAITLGVNQVFLRMIGNNVAAGLQFTMFAAPQLADVYGNNPMSLEVYLRFYPHVMHMHHVQTQHRH